MLQIEPFSGNQRSDILTCLTDMPLVPRLPREMHLCRSSSNVPRLLSFLELLQTFMFCSLFWQGAESVTMLEHSKMVWMWWVFTILTSKCASRHNGVHLFKISTSKSVPALRCFYNFHFEICFGSQRRALFLLVSCENCSDHAGFLVFWLPNLLRATTAWSLMPQDGPAPAALARLLLDPPEPQNIGKTYIVVPNFSTFWRALIFFWLRNFFRLERMGQGLLRAWD